MYDGRNVSVLIMAAGAGSRMNCETPKQFLPIKGVPVLRISAGAFAECGHIDKFYVVSAREFMEKTDKTLKGIVKYSGVFTGGDTRQESVLAGLRSIALSGDVPDIILIHDAVRPYVSRELIDDTIKTAIHHGIAIPAMQVSEAVYRSDTGAARVKTGKTGIPIERDEIFIAQTPQAFSFDMILTAHEHAVKNGIIASDDGGIAGAYGMRPVLVPGERSNIKITVPEDLPEDIHKDIRVGIGYDVHAFKSGRPLILGGVEIPFEKGLAGHSDADVLTHAVMDAMLGALGIGDIGKLFPDTDDKYRDISSMKLLASVRSMVEEQGYDVYNIDTTVICEKPKISPHSADIALNLANALGVPRTMVSIKATTEEGLGFTGHGEGVAAQAVVLLKNIVRRKEE